MIHAAENNLNVSRNSQDQRYPPESQGNPSSTRSLPQEEGPRKGPLENPGQRMKIMNAEEAFRELEALSSSISHDLRAPLRAIRSNCDWLCMKQSFNLDAEAKRILNQITVSTDQMERLLDALLAFSKVVQISPERTQIDMTALVRSVLNELIQTGGEVTPVDVRLPALLPAYGDATLIHQVWYNLLSNALKFTQYQPKRIVEIDSYIMNGEQVYSVRDNGIGFDMKYVHELFGVFHRLHEIEEYGGTGVGLAIVERIIRGHGGRVWAEGQENNGARFYFTLPTEN